MLKQHYVLRTLCKTHKIDIRSFFIRLQKTNRHDFFICTVFLWSEFKLENIYSGVNFWEKNVCRILLLSPFFFFFFFFAGTYFCEDIYPADQVFQTVSLLSAFGLHVWKVTQRCVCCEFEFCVTVRSLIEDAPLLTKTVKINQSEGIPGSGIPERFLPAFPHLSPQSSSTFHRFLYFAPLSTI